MKKLLLNVFLLSVVAVNTAAQEEGYQITARTSGIKDSTVYLVACNTDTLARTEMKNGNFFMSGKLKEPTVAYIRTAAGAGIIPLMLENANFQIVANAQGVKVVGGEAQERYDRYNAISQATIAEQAKVQKEMQAAMQEGNQMKMAGLQNDFGKFVEKMRKQESGAFDSLVNDFVGMYILSANMHDMTAEMLRARYDKFNDSYKNSTLGKAVAEYLDQIERISVGRIVPDFTLPSVEGDSISVHKLKGKVKIVDFWASWCGPCRKESANLVKLYRNYQTKGLQILGVSIDDKADAWKKAMFEDGMTWKNVSDLKGQGSPLLPMFNIRSIPFTLVLDSENRIVAINLRGAELEKKVAEMLK